MLGASDSNLVWYQLGQWSAERADRHRRIADMVIWGLRPVEVDQSYLDDLHAELQRAAAAADHNYRMGEEWIARALRAEAEKAALETHAIQLEADKATLVAAGNSALDLVDESDYLHRESLDRAKAQLEQERQAHEKTADERDGLKEFQAIMAVLFDAERNGKSAMPEHRRLKRLAEGICFILTSGKDPSQFIMQIRAAVDTYQEALTS